MKETENQVKFQETTEQLQLFKTVKKGNPTRRYHPESFPSPIPTKAVANAKKALLVQLSDTQMKNKSNRRKTAEKLMQQGIRIIQSIL